MKNYKNFKVEEVSIPKIKNEYLTDFRTVRFSRVDDSQWTVDCFMGGTDVSVNDEVEVSVKSMRDCNPSSLIRDGWGYFHDYLCVSSHKDTDDYCIYEFYRDAVKDNNEVVKPYSFIFGRTTEKFNVGDSYVFCYRKVE